MLERGITLLESPATSREVALAVLDLLDLSSSHCIIGVRRIRPSISAEYLDYREIFPVDVVNIGPLFRHFCTPLVSIGSLGEDMYGIEYDPSLDSGLLDSGRINQVIIEQRILAERS